MRAETGGVTSSYRDSAKSEDLELHANEKRSYHMDIETFVRME